MTSAIDPETLEMTLDAIREFVSDALPDERLLDLDEKDEFPVDLVRQLLGEGLGIHLVFIPLDYGGMGGGAFDVYRVCEQMARIDLGVATGVLATFLGAEVRQQERTPPRRPPPVELAARYEAEGADEIVFDRKKDKGGQDTDMQQEQPLSDSAASRRTFENRRGSRTPCRRPKAR